MPELAGNLEERSFECFRIGAYVATAHRSLHAHQLDVELVGELVTQTVRRYPEVNTKSTGLPAAIKASGS